VAAYKERLPFHAQVLVLKIHQYVIESEVVEGRVVVIFDISFSDLRSHKRREERFVNFELLLNEAVLVPGQTRSYTFLLPPS